MNAVLVDINIVLDVLLERHPHFAYSAAIWSAIETGRIKGLLAAHAITTIDYLVRQQLGAAKAASVLSSLLRVFTIAPVDEAVIREALSLTCNDFQDAVAAAAARAAGCDAIVTHDPRGFRASPVRVLTPEAAAHLLATE